MDELIEAISNNGFARDSATLNDVISDTMQDGQYSASAHTNGIILRKYQAVYGNYTISEIKALKH